MPLLQSLMSMCSYISIPQVYNTNFKKSSRILDRDWEKGRCPRHNCQQDSSIRSSTLSLGFQCDCENVCFTHIIYATRDLSLNESLGLPSQRTTFRRAAQLFLPVCLMFVMSELQNSYIALTLFKDCSQRSIFNPCDRTCTVEACQRVAKLGLDRKHELFRVFQSSWPLKLGLDSNV